MATAFPPINLDPKATPWAKTAQQSILNLEREVARRAQAADNSDGAGTSTMATLSRQVQRLTSVVNTLTGVTNTLSAVANVQYQEWRPGGDGLTGFSGFYANSSATVTLTSPTGRLEVGFGGSLNSGNGYFCYSVTGATSGAIVSRESVQANPAQRVAVTGGASFVGSAFNTVIVNVPANEPLTVRLELYAASSMTYWFGGRILARVAP